MSNSDLEQAAIQKILSAFYKAIGNFEQQSNITRNALSELILEPTTLDEIQQKNQGLMPICTYLRELSNSNKLAEFAFLDFKLFPNSYNAIYIVLEKNPKNDFRRFAEVLKSIFTSDQISKIVFDSNKVIQNSGKFEPFIVSKKKVKDKLPCEFYVEDYNSFVFVEDYNSFVKKNCSTPSEEQTQHIGSVQNKRPDVILTLQHLLLKNCSRLFKWFKWFKMKCRIVWVSYVLRYQHINNSKNSDNVVEKIESIYKCFANNQKLTEEIIKSESISESIRTICTEEKKSVGGIDFENPKAAFLTYLYFISLIAPEDWKQYIYYPATIIKTDGKVEWIGGLLLAYTKSITSKERLYYKQTASFLVSNIYSQSIYGALHVARERTAISAIMSRNMSHNIGSHVLSTVTEDYIKKNSKNTLDFFAYLQKRMDLLARIVGTRDISGEPMFLIGDVLKGFFKQDLLLNHLVKDQRSFEKDKIKFKICLPGKNEYIFQYKENDDTAKDNEGNLAPLKKWVCDKDIPDLLVSIPGGEIGCQAFYLFLESMMRNSAKYGFNESATHFCITIKVEDCSSHYKISICDNLSLCDNKLADEIKAKIKEPIINEFGDLATKSLGIAEMKEACNFLIGPYGDKYPAHEENEKKYPLWVSCPGLPECHYNINEKKINCNVSCSCNHLTYTFNLLKPQMVAIVGNCNLQANANYGINKFSNLSELRNLKDTYQFVVIYVDGNNKDTIINEIKELHHFLPFRILLVDDSNVVTNNGLNGLPKNRVVICKSQEIKQASSEDFIISIYEAWIRNRWLKDQNQCVKLILAFDRNKNDSIFTKYSKMNNFALLSDKVVWTVDRTYWSNTYDEKITTNKLECNYYYCIYDNHSIDAKARNLLNTDKLLFLHQTGRENKKIFEALAAPPYQSDFTFKYFLLSLLEAALTKIIIIDERVAEGCIAVTPHYTKIDHFDNLNLCLCYPVFYVNNEELNTEVKNKINGMSEENKNKLWRLSSDNYGKLRLSSKVKSNNEEIEKKIEDADFIIVHYGLIETHKELKNIVNKLYMYNLASSVVITTGRGAGTIRDIGDLKVSELPFIEASILKDNTYPSISKYHLVKALMSAKGGN